MAEHHVQWTIRPRGYAVEGEIVCFAGENAQCRTVCYRSECEEGCVPDLLPLPHPREQVGYCNVKTWLENEDDGVVGSYSGPPTAPRTGAIKPIWEGHYFTWRYLRGQSSKP